MRSWHPIPPLCLDNKRLLGEHAELHAIHSILVNNLDGYSRHPEVVRWQQSLLALSLRHDLIVSEMTERGFHHRSPMNEHQVVMWKQSLLQVVCWPCTIEPVETMRQKLSEKLASRRGT